MTSIRIEQHVSTAGTHRGVTRTTVTSTVDGRTRTVTTVTADGRTTTTRS